MIHKEELRYLVIIMPVLTFEQYWQLLVIFLLLQLWHITLANTVIIANFCDVLF